MDQHPVRVQDVLPPRCDGIGGKKFYPEISLEKLAKDGVIYVRCPAGRTSQIHTGTADGEPVLIHDCRHCGRHEYL